MLSSSVRVTSQPFDPYPRNTGDDGSPADDLRFRDLRVPVQAIATSGAQSDAGLFELNFRDDRYLPFEGAGAISRWRIELVGNCSPRYR